MSEEKTVRATQYIVFLGILLDGKIFLLMLPYDKCEKANKMLQLLIGKRSATIKQLQCLTGTLNFLTKAIFAGRTFTRRMYAKCSNIKPRSGKTLKSYHHIKLDAKFKSDCRIWVSFLKSAETNKMVLCRPYVDLYSFDSSKRINFFTDTAKMETYGYGAFFNGQWLYGQWEPGFIKKYDPSIEYLELFALCAGIITWADQLKDCRIVIYCDNQAVIGMVNNLTSSCRNCMILLRILVLNGLYYNRRVLVKYVKSKENFLADSLSRGRLDLFWKKAPSMTKKYPDRILSILWPMSKLWVKN